MALVGGKKRILGNIFVTFKLDFFFTDLGNVGGNFRAEFFFQPFFSDCSGGNTYGGFAGGTSTTAAVVACAVFVPVGVIGVSGTEAGGDIAIVFAALVGITDQEGDGGAGGFAFEYSGEDFDLVGFAALGNVAAGAGFAAVKVKLDIRFAQF